MIEKTTATIEPSAVRRIWPTCKKHLKSQPGLHLRHHEATYSEYSSFLPQEIVMWNKVPAMTYFDFLYPSGFLGFFRQFTGFEPYKSDRVLSKLYLGIRNYHYHSSPRNLHNPRSFSSRGREICPKSQLDFTTLLEKLGLSKDTKTSEVWARFKNSSQDFQKSFSKALLSYLHHSAPDSDANRIIELFKELDLYQRDAETCEFAVQAYLKHQNLSEAMKVYNFAVTRLKTLAGLDQILRYTVKNHMWTEAYNLWKVEKSLQIDYNFYRFVDESAPEISTALSLSKWVNEMQGFGKLPSPEIIKFSITIIEKALQGAKYHVESEYLALLKSISDWKPLSREIYSNTIISLSKSKRENILMKSYKLLRLNHNFYLSQTALIQVLQLSCDRHDVIYMKYVLDDFFSLHSKPSRAAYRMCLKEFSRQGDAKTVHALFKQYIGRYRFNTIETMQRTRHEVKLRSRLDKSGQSYLFEEIDEAAPLTSNDFAPLLHVHARRGEVGELEKIFSQMRIFFEVEPNILCWNIRLGAYMKIRDVDQVYQCFEEILENPNLSPDHYTLGTMMALYASRADLVRARDICNMAQKMDIPMSVSMVNCLVTCLLRNDQYPEAEIICQQSSKMGHSGSKTQIWNSLVMGYVVKRDLPNVNKTLKYMSENNIEYDQYTYSAFMQALAITRQPYLAARVLFEVMPRSGIKPSLFHFAILLGGYLAIRDWKSFDSLHQAILKSNMRPNASTKLLALKAAVSEDSILFESGTVTQKFLRSLSIFSETMVSIDPQEISDTARKGYGQLPLDVMYPAMFYSFIAYILSQNNEHQIAFELLSEYKSWIPESRKKAGEVMKIITALMSTLHATNDVDGVRNCWEKALFLAKEESDLLAPLPQTESSSKVTEQGSRYFHQLVLNKPFEIYMKSLMAQKKTKELNETVQSLISYGFDLDNHNWNEYVKYISRKSNYYKLAFHVCEIKLMPGWQGWRIQRRKLVGRRSNVPLEVRRKKLDPRSLRPYFDTLLWLGRRMINIRAKAAESPQIQKLLNFLRNEYPNTLKAIDGIPRSDNEVILKSNDSQFEL